MKIKTVWTQKIRTLKDLRSAVAELKGFEDSLVVMSPDGEDLEITLLDSGKIFAVEIGEAKP